MAKKTTKKRKVKRKTSKKHVKKRPARKPTIKRTTSQVQVEKTLINNFIALQKVMTNFAMKFDDLSKQMTKLLDIFTISAKALAEKDFDIMSKKDHEDILKRLDNMSEQNKVLARGLTLLHEKPDMAIPAKPASHPAQPRPMPMMPKKPLSLKSISAKPPQKRPAPPVQTEPALEDGSSVKEIGLEGGYQRSISAKPTKFKKL
ncbi:hypothetical protein ACFLZJ_01860 [Nanoarchaeota archaeon]